MFERGMSAAVAAAMLRISDALELLTAQHAQIDDLFDLVATLRDPDVLDELADTLAFHLSIEHELLYPSLSPPLTREILDELAAEHDEIRRVLAELVWFGERDEDFEARLESLGLLLDGHVGYQEDELFTRAAGAMSGAQLVDLGTRMADSAAPFVYERAHALAS